MTVLTLKQANQIIDTALNMARRLNLAPLTVVVFNVPAVKGHATGRRREYDSPANSLSQSVGRS